MTLNDVQQHAKDVGDVSSVGIAGGALMGFLPELAALASIVWVAVRVYDYFRFERPEKLKDKE
jgi:hypothetical protein